MGLCVVEFVWAYLIALFCFVLFIFLEYKVHVVQSRFGLPSNVPKKERKEKEEEEDDNNWIPKSSSICE